MKSALSPIFWLSQWSTFRSGPLATPEAHENRPKSYFLAEPVVYFPEWSTSSPETHEICPKPGILAEPVVHFPEWSTGYLRIPRNLP